MSARELWRQAPPEIRKLMLKVATRLYREHAECCCPDCRVAADAIEDIRVIETEQLLRSMLASGSVIKALEANGPDVLRRARELLEIEQ